jgi:putative DNA primase/helicase
LERKGLSAVGTQALRIWGDALVVPVLWKGRILSLQSITPDGEKRFWPGAPVKGGALVLDRPRAALTAVCEGLATGLAIFQSVRNARVIVAFDAGNLSPVVDTMRPTGSVVICADDDHGTQARRGFNPGRQKATNAAELIGAGVAWPEGIEGTDWADALAEWGVSAHRRIERQIQAKARYVT